MRAAVFWGCRILTSQYAYEMSTREVLPKLGVGLVDLREALCCGDPVRSVNDFVTTYLSARIIALAGLTGSKDLLVPCNRCHFILSEAKRSVETDKRTFEKIHHLLDEEGLEYSSDMKMWHIVDLLHDHVGLSRIKKAIVRPLNTLRLASHIGCQLIRYSDLGRADDSENPRKLDELVSATGAKNVDYNEKLDCCGAHLTLSHLDSALSLTGSKLKALHGVEVDGLVVSCPDCGMMYDSKQKEAATIMGAKLHIPVVYYTQLLGLALGIEQMKLGLHLNQSPVDEFLAKISA